MFWWRRRESNPRPVHCLGLAERLSPGSRALDHMQQPLVRPRKLKAQPSSRTATTGRGDNAPLWCERRRHPTVSGSGSPRLSPPQNTPWNSGNFPGTSRLGGESGIRTVRWGESKANPNRPTRQRRLVPTPGSSMSGTHSLRFGPAPALAQNPAQSRGFGEPDRAPGAESLRRPTSWRWNQSAANSSLQLDSLIGRENTRKPP